MRRLSTIHFATYQSCSRRRCQDGWSAPSSQGFPPYASLHAEGTQHNTQLVSTLWSKGGYGSSSEDIRPERSNCSEKPTKIAGVVTSNLVHSSGVGFMQLRVSCYRLSTVASGTSLLTVCLSVCCVTTGCFVVGYPLSVRPCFSRTNHGQHLLA